MQISVRRLLTLAVCLVLVASIGTALAVRTVRDNRSGDRAGTFAFVTEQEVVVMRHDRVVVRVPRLSDSADPHEYKMVWTHNGRYLVFLSDATVRQEESEAIELVIVDAEEGTVRAVACGDCDAFTPVHEQGILVQVTRGSGSEFRVEHRVIRADGDASATAADPFSAQMPWGLLLVSSTEYVITNRQANGGEALQLTSLDGTVNQSLGQFDSNAYMPAAVSADSETGDPIFAIGFRSNPGSCGAFPIDLFRSDGIRTSTDMTQAAPNGVEKWEYGVEVEDLWTEPDGTLHATIATTDCRSPSADGTSTVTKSPSVAYRLDGQVWAREGFEPATTLRRLDRHSAAVLVQHDCSGDRGSDEGGVSYCNAGTLYLDRDGDRRALRDDVIAISAPTRR
ncbi:hypothetical protein Q3V37_17740 [Micromonospora profundi]|uniref:PKD domain-containing protein n=1 Tax=Micromonospora profundi TaxID=1420889 RepID=A0AAJ6HNF9_9ACTN|nr:hypothetical protein [Micromonospora profundi]WLS43262.1 hypothetical protein Q3V37_17740 [Micromonospora profundi]